MLYLIIVFLVFLTVLLGLIAVQLIRIEKAIVRISEVVEEQVLQKIE